MTEPVSSSSSSSHQSSDGGGSGGMTIDIRPMIEDVSQVMTKHITSILTGVIGEYTVYKETHDTIMGLPCVRKLQERIIELETHDNNKGLRNISACGGDGSMRREDEIHQLQTAIAELNRYILALESKVDMKTVTSSSQNYSAVEALQSVAEHVHEEESIRLEIHENEPVPKTNREDTFVPSSNTKNVIVSSSGVGDIDCCDVDQDQEEDDRATETTEDLASLVETVKQEIENEAEEEAEEQEEAEAEEEADEQEEAAEEQAEAEEAEAEAEAEEEEAEEQEEVEEEADEQEAAEEQAEEQEEADEPEQVEEDQSAAEEEAEIEVSEIKIKGKTYFTTDPQNGIIYACVDDDVGDEVGVFKNGVAVFNKGKK